jgi:hypothetical protein
MAGAVLLSMGLAAAPVPAHEGEAVPLAVSAEAEARYAKLVKLLVPTAAAKIAKLAKESAPHIIAGDGGGFEPNAKQGVQTTWAVLGSMSAADIEAIAFLVLMQAARSAQEDLKAIMAGVKAINDAKAKARGNLDKVKAEMAARKTTDCKAIKQSPPVLASKTPSLGVSLYKVSPVPSVGDPKPLTKDQLATLCGELKAVESSLSELGEEQQLKMQMVMDRMTKADQMMSNLAKKVSDTSSGIIQNLK